MTQTEICSLPTVSTAELRGIHWFQSIEGSISLKRFNWKTVGGKMARSMNTVWSNSEWWI